MKINNDELPTIRFGMPEIGYSIPLPPNATQRDIDARAAMIRRLGSQRSAAAEDREVTPGWSEL